MWFVTFMTSAIAFVAVEVSRILQKYCKTFDSLKYLALWFSKLSRSNIDLKSDLSKGEVLRDFWKRHTLLGISFVAWKKWIKARKKKKKPGKTFFLLVFVGWPISFCEQVCVCVCVCVCVWMRENEKEIRISFILRSVLSLHPLYQTNQPTNQPTN